MTVQECKEFVEEYIRPRVNGDGGEVEFVSFENDTLTVNMLGECSKCIIVKSCFKEWFEAEIEKKFGKKIKIIQNLKRPYFVDQ